jgi:hypothetical protein
LAHERLVLGDHHAHGESRARGDLSPLAKLRELPSLAACNISLR